MHIISHSLIKPVQLQIKMYVAEGNETYMWFEVLQKINSNK